MNETKEGVSSPTIEQTLVEHNLTESTLIAMEEEYSGLTIEGIQDKEGYKKVSQALTLLRNTRTLTVEVCKKGREDAIKVQKDWIAKEKAIVSRIQAVELTLKERRELIDTELERIKTEEATKKAAILAKRTSALLGYKMILDVADNSYYIPYGDNTRINILTLQTSEDESFDILLNHVKGQFDAQQALEEAERIKKVEEEAKIRALAEENSRRAEELAKREAEMAAKEAAIKKQQEEAELLKKQAEEAKKREEEAQVRAEQERLRILSEAKHTARKQALYALGLSQTGSGFVFDNIILRNEVELAHLLQQSDSDFDNSVKELSIMINTRKDALLKAAEDKRIADEKIAQEALLAKQKAEAEAKSKEEARVAAMAPDSEKFDSYIKALNNVPIPVFNSSPEFINFNSYVKNTFTQFVKHLESKKPC